MGYFLFPLCLISVVFLCWYFDERIEGVNKKIDQIIKQKNTGLSDEYSRKNIEDHGDWLGEELERIMKERKERQEGK